MIHHVQGNLLLSDCNVIAHQSNCMGGFGSGIAGQIRYMFPQALAVFEADTRTPQQKLGSLCWADCVTPDNAREMVVFNLYGQFNYGPKGQLYTRYPMLEKAIDEMRFMLKSYNQPVKLGMPYKIGCDLAGGDWEVVEEILYDRFGGDSDMDLWLYEFTPPAKRF